jgi:cobalt/nickel transport system permease protein
MHISEGVLSAPVLIGGGALAAAGTVVGLKKTDLDKVANVGILSAAFFVASLVHVNIGPSSVHLILNGIIGLILGWAAFPAILVALFLQSIFFQFGGITALGVNTVNVALPAVLGFYVFRPLIFKSGTVSSAAAFLSGAGAVFVTAIMVAISLLFTEESFWKVTVLVVSAHVPVMIIEGIVSVFCIAFFKRVHPEIFETVISPTAASNK